MDKEALAKKLVAPLIERDLSLPEEEARSFANAVCRVAQRRKPDLSPETLAFRAKVKAAGLAPEDYKLAGRH